MTGCGGFNYNVGSGVAYFKDASLSSYAIEAVTAANNEYYEYDLSMLAYCDPLGKVASGGVDTSACVYDIATSECTITCESG